MPQNYPESPREMATEWQRGSSDQSRSSSPTACSRNLTLAIRPRTWSGLGALAVLVEPIGGPSAGEGYKPNSRSIAPVSRRFGIL